MTLAIGPHGVLTPPGERWSNSRLPLSATPNDVQAHYLSVNRSSCVLSLTLSSPVVFSHHGSRACQGLMENVLRYRDRTRRLHQCYKVCLLGRTCSCASKVKKRQFHARLAPHRSYAQGVQCFLRSTILCRKGYRKLCLLVNKCLYYTYLWQYYLPLAQVKARGGVVVRLLASHLEEPGSIPGGVAAGLSHVGNCAGRRRWSEGFLGDLPFPPSLFVPTLSFSPRSTFVGFLRHRRPNPFIAHFRARKNTGFELLLLREARLAQMAYNESVFTVHVVRRLREARLTQMACNESVFTVHVVRRLREARLTQMACNESVFTVHVVRRLREARLTQMACNESVFTVHVVRRLREARLAQMAYNESVFTVHVVRSLREARSCRGQNAKAFLNAHHILHAAWVIISFLSTQAPITGFFRLPRYRNAGIIFRTQVGAAGLVPEFASPRGGMTAYNSNSSRTRQQNSVVCHRNVERSFGTQRWVHYSSTGSPPKQGTSRDQLSFDVRN
ncbi:hypothetical protein PR048_030059 [Dryococelus australis]|uniref:Uncharacterized protein n=1 Tax=Dryococelus australis TaxID=614101 RepID=A0ABQ9GBT4_9NEOP|nr:hypothetical protein PR048_030059 [Dryococelus australis]